MKTSRIYHVYDSHTAGNSTRLLLEGVPALAGRSVRERRMDFQRNHDYIRTTLTQEPRGNSGILAVLVSPSDPNADYGVIFSDYRGYVDVCIHGTIGVVTTLVECGLVPEKILKLRAVVLETSAGLVKTRFRFSNGKVESVTVRNVPSFFLKNTQIELPRFGKVEVSISFGGNFYAYVDAKDLKLKIEPSNLRNLLYSARSLLEELKNTRVRHPLLPDINEIVGVSFYEDLGPNLARNVMIAEEDLFDRSPCGTGTCGRVALLHATGRMKTGETLRNRSIIGTEFLGTISSETKVKNLRAIVPEITGSAFLTGISDLIVSEGDGLANGFMIR